MVGPAIAKAAEARIPALLSVNGGYVDTMSFIGLHGLFAAHVTGNFVTLGAALVTGTTGQYVFPGGKARKPLSNMAMLELLRGMREGDLTVHGFRSSFRDWAGESMYYPRELAEAALGHVFGDAAERAYRRGDALGKRRELMEHGHSIVHLWRRTGLIT